MTIVYLLRYYPTLTETFVYQEIQALLDKGLNIEIISMGIREDGRLADNLPNVTVHNVPRAYRFSIAHKTQLWHRLSHAIPTAKRHRTVPLAEGKS